MYLLWLFSLAVHSCSAMIYSLNETEYNQMPPLWELASYSRCMSQHGTYCVLQLSLEPGDNHQLWNTIQEYSAHTSKHYNHSIIERGVCVTETCREYITGTTAELKAPLEACLNSRVRRAWGVGARVSALHYCERHDERARSDAWDGAVRAALLALVAINAAATIYDYRRKKYKTGNKLMNRYLLSFSIKRNWERLIDTDMKNEKSRDLLFGHGTRVITSLCTLVLHVILVYGIGFTKNPHDIEKTYDQTSYHLFYSGLVFLQIFFFTSGFLKSYDLQMEKEKLELSVRDFPRTMLLRYTRLVPALSVVLALSTSWLRLAGSGPLWRLFLSDSLAADCRACWWHHLLFINNYTQRGKFCLLPTWHLAADMQVFAVSVLAYLGWPRLLFPLLLMSAAAPAVHTLLQDLDVVMITPEFFRTLENRSFWILHVLGHNNLTSFILGMLTAERLYSWRKTGGHRLRKWWWSAAQYSSVAGIPLLILSGQVFYDQRADVITRAVYNAGIRLSFGLLCTLTTFAFFSKTPTYLKSVLEWRGWVLPSRLAYCVMLVHMVVVHVMAGARTELSVYSSYNVMTSYVTVVLLSYLAAIPLHLFVEAPFTTLFKELLRKPTINKLEQNSNITDENKVADNLNVYKNSGNNEVVFRKLTSNKIEDNSKLSDNAKVDKNSKTRRLE